jgi:hypothetical protein
MISREGIFSDAAAVTPHNSNANEYKALWVGATGALKVKTQGGTDVTIASVPDGAYIPLSVVLVYQTGTTATSIVGLK